MSHATLNVILRGFIINFSAIKFENKLVSNLAMSSIDVFARPNLFPATGSVLVREVDAIGNTIAKLIRAQAFTLRIKMNEDFNNMSGKDSSDDRKRPAKPFDQKEPDSPPSKRATISTPASEVINDEPLAMSSKV